MVLRSLGGRVVLPRRMIEGRLRLRLLISSMLLLGVVVLLLIVPMMVCVNSRLLCRRWIITSGLVLSVAGGHHTLLGYSLGHRHRGRSLGSSIHRCWGAGVGHHQLGDTRWSPSLPV